jgi:hypothetical protein
MNKTKKLLTAFAVFASILMLMTTTMARTLQERTVVEKTITDEEIISMDQQAVEDEKREREEEKLTADINIENETSNAIEEIMEAFFDTIKDDPIVQELLEQLENDEESSFLSENNERVYNRLMEYIEAAYPDEFAELHAELGALLGIPPGTSLVADDAYAEEYEGFVPPNNIAIPSSMMVLVLVPGEDDFYVDDEGNEVFVDPVTGEEYPICPDTGNIIYTCPETGDVVYICPETGNVVGYVCPETGDIIYACPETGELIYGLNINFWELIGFIGSALSVFGHFAVTPGAFAIMISYIVLEGLGIYVNPMLVVYAIYGWIGICYISFIIGQYLVYLYHENKDSG